MIITCVYNEGAVEINSQKIKHTRSPLGAELTMLLNASLTTDPQCISIKLLNSNTISFGKAHLAPRLCIPQFENHCYSVYQNDIKMVKNE